MLYRLTFSLVVLSVHQTRECNGPFIVSEPHRCPQKGYKGEYCHILQGCGNSGQLYAGLPVRRVDRSALNWTDSLITPLDFFSIV